MNIDEFFFAKLTIAIPILFACFLHFGHSCVLLLFQCFFNYFFVQFFFATHHTLLEMVLIITYCLSMLHCGNVAGQH